MDKIITTHKNTDFDALASVVAASLLVPDARPALPKSINPNVKAFLSFHKDVFDLPDTRSVDLAAVSQLIVVDTADWRRLDRLNKLEDKQDLKVWLWDHHHQPAGIQAQWHCHEPMGANITLMIRQLREERKILTPIQATLFLLGLYEDTGNLTFPSSTAEDAYAAAYLLERKADLGILARFLRPAYGQQQKDVLFQMLQSAKRSRINGHKVSLSQVALKGHVDSLALVVRMFRDIMNVDAAFGVFSDPDGKRCMVIGRSDAEGLNVGDIMRSLGGGGHPGAGSALLKAVRPEAVVQMIRDLIAGNQQSSVQISDLMSFPVHAVEADMAMEEVAMVLRKKGCTGLPVVDQGKLVGVISRRDFKKLKKDNQFKAPVKAFMSRNVQTIAPGHSPLQAAQLMVRHDIGRLPVVEDDRIIGIITRSDTMLYFYDLLPD